MEHLEKVVDKLWLGLFESATKNIKIDLFNKTERVLGIPKLTQTQLEIMSSLIKNMGPTLIKKDRRTGTSTAIYLFLVGNLVIGKYKKVALVNNCEAASYFAMNKIRKMVEQTSLIIKENSKHRLNVNDNIIETVPLDIIDRDRNLYDLIIFDNIDSIDKPDCKIKDYGVSIYTSEKAYVENRIYNLEKEVYDSIKQIESKLLELNVLQEKLKYYEK